ncbi:hypothetical protein CDAR_253911 [Caerostris darwini]|uniref:Ycf15 n=1 Tax=Caerostris darwini TaxID=1538125 RepID=A0AAV4Q4L4_9ARAC|nr:hypothetical protein CDAR_253911 [Caerostris darwini]
MNHNGISFLSLIYVNRSGVDLVFLLIFLNRTDVDDTQYSYLVYFPKTYSDLVIGTDSCLFEKDQFELRRMPSNESWVYIWYETRKSLHRVWKVDWTSASSSFKL